MEIDLQPAPEPAPAFARPTGVPRRVCSVMRLPIVVALCGVLLAATAHAGDWLWTNPATGAQRNARGPGINVDAFGRAYRDTPSNAWVFQPVQPNAYGLGVGSDALGRPVVPTYTNPFLETR
jgi:hypothetical protein